MFLPRNKTEISKPLLGVVLIVFFFSSLFVPLEIKADHNDDDSKDLKEIKEKISDRNKKIDELEREIRRYEEEVAEISKEKQTLQNAVRSLDISRRKITADIEATENKISNSELQIRRLELEIELQRQKMEQNKEAMAGAFVELNEAESASLIETLLAHENLSDFWDELESLERFKSGIRNNMATLRDLEKELEANKEGLQDNIENLEVLQSDLAGKRAAVDVNKAEKSELLQATANEEASYQRLIAEKEAKRDAFLRELREFEAQLDFNIDPGKIPASGSGVLRWPLDSIIITQRFGDTAFARTGAYNGNGHNGVDFGTPVGTSVRSALSGIVKGVGNTDTVCPNASYGKWILVEHYNGLTTLYAHLSGFNINVGQEVTSGQIIGYSGNTGYSTGPHLHFTAYATEGVRVVDRPSAVCGGIYTLPVADLEAYLDPLQYL